MFSTTVEARLLMSATSLTAWAMTGEARRDFTTWAQWLKKFIAGMAWRRLMDNIGSLRRHYPDQVQRV